MRKRDFTVLFAENNKQARESTAKLLSLIFTKVIVVEDGHSAYENYESEDIDLLITDMSMPSDGVTLINRIREKDKILPIIVHTAHSEFKQIYKNIPFIYTLFKPFTLGNLKAILNNVDSEVEFYKKHKQAYRQLQEVSSDAYKILEFLWGDKGKCSIG